MLCRSTRKRSNDDPEPCPPYLQRQQQLLGRSPAVGPFPLSHAVGLRLQHGGLHCLSAESARSIRTTCRRRNVRCTPTRTQRSGHTCFSDSADRHVSCARSSSSGGRLLGLASGCSSAYSRALDNRQASSRSQYLACSVAQRVRAGSAQVATAHWIRIPTHPPAASRGHLIMPTWSFTARATWQHSEMGWGTQHPWLRPGSHA
jgi:hypothetical protein